MNMLPQQSLLPPSSHNNIGSPDGSLPFSNLDPFAAKQMAALQATSLAKAGNRSAPGGTSASYFGGMSLNNPSRPASSSGQELSATPMSAIPHFQAQGQPPNPQAGHLNPAFMQQQQQQQQQQMQYQKKRQFLNGLARVMFGLNRPLPPNLTGVPIPPGFDTTNSPWRSLEVSPTELGVIRLGGKDVDLYKLWALVQQAGGGAKVIQQRMWGQLLTHLDLPEQIALPNGQIQSTPATLQNYYLSLIGPFEDAYRKNQGEQQRAMLGRGPSGGPMPGQGSMNAMPSAFAPQMNAMSMPSGTNPNMGLGASASGADIPLSGIGNSQFSTAQSLAHTPQQMPSSGLNGTPDIRSGLGPMGAVDSLAASTGVPTSQLGGFPSFSGQVPQMNASDLDQDAEGRKRKMRESEELDAKRARQRTNGSDASDPRSSVGPGSIPGVLNSNGPNLASAVRTVRQPSRRRIEYVPLAREVDTAGGRDLDSFVHELNSASQRPIREINDWGTVDIEALTMSIRSRIATELSYALATLTILTLMRSHGKEGGLQLSQTPDLFEEILDLLEDVAFEGSEDAADLDMPMERHITTHREMVNSLVESESQPFAGLQPKQGRKDPALGHRQRPAELCLTVINIVRNLSLYPENQDYLAKHNRFLSILLRLCSLAHPQQGQPPHPASPALSLNDFVALRKECVQVLGNMASSVQLAPKSLSSSAASRNARRAFELLASYLTDPTDAASPITFVPNSPSQLQTSKPPSLADTALEAFTRLSQPDENRQAFAKALPSEWIWLMVEALVHRLPISDLDYFVVMRDAWLPYLERLIIALYSIAYLSPPAVKQRIKTDRQLGYTKVMLRLIKKLTSVGPEIRHHFVVCARRAIETMKIIDDGEDSFDTSHSTVPTLSFGMGYGEHGETQMEKGMGLLSGYQEDVTWGIMMQRDVDDVIFAELASMVRVG